jgi:hypothetical protein
MSTKRIKISFSSINQGKISEIPRQSIIDANQAVKSAMTQAVREFEKKETKSLQDAALLVLNA